MRRLSSPPTLHTRDLEVGHRCESSRDGLPCVRRISHEPIHDVDGVIDHAGHRKNDVVDEWFAW